VNSQKEAHHNGSAFEKEIARSFEAYGTAGVAFLDFMPVPSRRVFIRGRAQLIATGKPPFDIYGFLPRLMVRSDDREDGPDAKCAVMIGAECKSCGEPATSLSIVKTGGDSAGVEQHQLEALANVARHGGIARIIWSNGGEVGVLTEGGILAAHAIYEASLATERRGKGKGPAGSRSIKWGNFKRVPIARIGDVPAVIDWLFDERGK
jgi:hypothetical protein